LIDDNSAALDVCGRWLYCVHKVQDYPNVGFSHAVAYQYKTNMADSRILTEVCCITADTADVNLFAGFNVHYKKSVT
jgi:hypothetical protein